MNISKFVFSGILISSGSFLFLLSFYNFQLPYVDAEESPLAPDYQATNIDGIPVSLKDYKGKIVLVNLWATWCEPCRNEMPSLEKLQNMYSKNEFEIIGVSVDEPRSENMIKQFLESENISYTIWLDPTNKFQFLFRTIGVPESFLIDRDGKIVYHWKGAFDPTSEDTIKLVQSVIAETTIQSPQSPLLSDGLVAGSAIAFTAGILSFLSPCVLPLIPVYASLITGLGMQELSNKSTNSSRYGLRFSATSKGILFVIGFSTVFILLGATVSFMGTLFLDATQWIERIGGIVLIVLGIHMIGIIRIPYLERQMRLDLAKRNSGKIGPLVVGMAFAAGWTPCIGPILAGILTIAASSTSVVAGSSLLAIYSLGLAVPFLISAITIDKFLVFFSKIKTKMLWIERISGILFIVFGIILLTGSLTILNNLFAIKI